MHAHRRCAFTLVELLVVIAIIALLISILLPSLAKAREQAKEIRCLANMKDMTAAFRMYAETDRGENLIPVNARYTEAPLGVGVDAAGQYLAAAKRTFGGKSGRHDYVEVQDHNAWGSGEFTGRYSTENGMGPATRPLNRIIYKTEFPDKRYAPPEEARKDEKLELDVFKCPSDVGYVAGKDGSSGTYLGLGIFYKTPESFYDNFGTSYFNDSILLGNAAEGVISIGAWLRPSSQIVRPSETTVLKEAKGHYASGWNAIPVLPPNPEEFTVGNHGDVREHLTAFADGHASSVLYEVSTDVLRLDTSYQAVHTGDFELRGGRLESMPENSYIPPFGEPPLTVLDIPHLLFSGPGWTDHCFPAPAYVPQVFQ